MIIIGLLDSTLEECLDVEAGGTDGETDTGYTHGDTYTISQTGAHSPFSLSPLQSECTNENHDHSCTQNFDYSSHCVSCFPYKFLVRLKRRHRYRETQARPWNPRDGGDRGDKEPVETVERSNQGEKLRGEKSTDKGDRWIRWLCTEFMCPCLCEGLCVFVFQGDLTVSSTCRDPRVCTESGFHTPQH